MQRSSKISKLFLLFILILTILFSFIPTISAAVIKITSDPTRIGVGARALGMGKAFVGLADDSTAMFLNPAGLAQLKNWQITTMSTKLIQEIDYLSIGGVYPTNYGNFGFGYVGASISGSFITGVDLVEDPEGRVYPVIGLTPINYNNSVLLLSYARKAKEIMEIGLFDNVSVGANLKLFSQSISGVTGEGSASGIDMDLGFLYKSNDWLSFGVNLIDFMPMTLSTGTVEQSIPATMKIGTAVKFMGQRSLYGGENTLYGLFDLDYKPEQTNFPMVFHTGIEFWPSETLALRCGIDQDIVAMIATGEVGVTSNLCAGVGLLYEDFRFDYAYHQYGGVQTNDTHYISLSYGFTLPKLEDKAEAKPKTFFKMGAPADKSTVYDENIKINGRVIDLEDVRRITINDVEVPISFDGSFEVATKLVLGKNIFQVNSFDVDGKMLKSEKVRLLRLIEFKDVKKDYWAKDPIEALAVLGMTGGYPDGTFRPDAKITRGEFTTLLVRAKGIAVPDVFEQMFTDVPKTHWAAKYIQVGVAERLVTGYPDKTFKPGKSIVRAEGVTVLSRFAELQLPDLLLEGPFPDVPGRHWAAKAVSAAKSAGMLEYLLDKPFVPGKEMTRAEAVEVLSKTPFAAAKISDLKGFDTY